MKGVWGVLWPGVKRLSERTDAGIALTPDQERAIMDAAARNRSKLIYPYLMTLAWTGIRADEARMLKWEQVDFETGHITVGRSKTAAGAGRSIPIAGPLRMALERHAGWVAGILGPIKQDWYVFPMSNRGRPVDPLQPALSLKTAWGTVRETAKVTCRLHDLRHGFATKLGEAGIPEAVMLDMMGHVSPSMLRRYSHIRVEARKEAIAALEARHVGVPKESPKVSKAGLRKPSVTC
ncbi:MAG: site-specific integrase [Bryobacterales bacterium]|nr:site-specific integrase [Bryobacterales bacterium]